MDLLIALVLGVCATLIVEELHAHSTSIARWLIRRAARRVPEGHRARFHEEWMAHLNDAGTVLRKLSHAMGCLYAAHDIAKSQRRVRDNIVAELTAIRGVFGDDAMKRLDDSPIRQLLVTVSIETQPVKLSGKVKVISIAPLLGPSGRGLG